MRIWICWSVVRYVFGPPGSGSGSISLMYGSGSFYHQAKLVRKTLIRLHFDFLPLKNDVNVPSKSNKQKKQKKYTFLLVSWRSVTKIAGSGAGSKSVSQRHGSVYPDPYQNFTDPQHWLYLSRKPRLGLLVRLKSSLNRTVPPYWFYF